LKKSKKQFSKNQKFKVIFKKLEYRLREKDILMEENRNLTRELKLLDLIIENFIPQDEVNLIN
jgi:hypothetical protein